jgi:F420H(2)-dependent quinone reductase
MFLVVGDVTVNDEQPGRTNGAYQHGRDQGPGTRRPTAVRHGKLSPVPSSRRPALFGNDCDNRRVRPEKLGRLLMRAAPLFNAPVAALATSPHFGRLLNGNIAMLTYTGRRSGRTFSIPVAYRRADDTVTITVSMPEAKTWWRNFLDDGAPLTLQLDGSQRVGHAVAQQDEKGRVTVTVRLTNT